MSGRNGWSKPFQSPGRPAKAPEIERCPEGSWWLLPQYQQDRAAFLAKVEQEQPRMQRRGVHSDPLVWKA